MNNPNSPVLIRGDDGIARASSLEVSEKFSKQHAHVLRAIDDLRSSAPETISNFGDGYYRLQNTGQQQHRCIFMDRMGFTLLAMGFTGAAAIKWKIAYIQAFDAMEAALRNREPAKLPSVRELAQMVIDAENRAEASEAARLSFAKQVADLGNQNIGLSQELHTTKGIATLAANGVSLLTALLGSQESIPLRDAANQLEQPQHEFNEWLFKKGGWIYRSKSRSGRWKPHATAIAKGWLGDKQFIRPKDNSAAPVLLTPEMGFVDPNIFYIFRDVEVTPAGMVRILQYADHPKPDAPALIRARQEIRV